MRHVEATIFRRSGAQLWLSLAIAFVFVCFTLLQLFSFEDMTSVIQVLLPANTSINAQVLITFIVVLEVFAVPYFLPIALSPLARICAGVCAVIVPVVWGVLNVSAVASNQAANAGFVSPKIHLDAGAISIAFLTLLLVFTLVLMYLDRRSHT